MEPHQDDSSTAEQALTIPLILDQIFSNLSTNFLLRSCSLVNKVWCREASRFIHNYRDCKVVQDSDKSSCEFLEDLDRVVGQIIQNGRTVPYNGLKVSAPSDVWGKCPSTSVIAEVLQNGNLKGNLKVKHLDIVSNVGPAGEVGIENDCPVHHPIAELLRQRGSQLESLKFSEVVAPLDNILGEDWCLSFPKLEILDISAVYFQDEVTEEGKHVVEKLLNLAPKLKRVIAGHVTQLELIPKDKMPLLCEFLPQFDYRMITKEDINLLEIIPVECSSKIQKLRIFVPPFDGQSQGNQFSEEDEFVDVMLLGRFDLACERLLHACHSNLDEISIHGVFPLGQLPYLPPLTKMSSFKVTKRYVGGMVQLWDSIRTIDYERMMPGLEKMEISIHTYSHSRTGYLPDSDFRAMWPPDGDNDSHAIHSSSTVRELTLELQIALINLRPLKAVFPNVTTLHFKVMYTANVYDDIAPLTQIWQYFSQLEQLKIIGEGGYVCRNYDADFCGLFEEEVQLLRMESEEYLRAVEIVPIRPSIVTMSNLRELQVRFSRKKMWFEHQELTSQDELHFISKVTRLIAFDRMPQVKKSLPRFMEPPRSDGQDEYDEEEEEDEGDDDNTVEEDSSGWEETCVGTEDGDDL